MHIKLDNVSVRFPIFDTKQRSFKQTVLNAATGGKILKSGKLTEIEALKNICLDIKEGDRIALLGHNGSGKTTLLRVLAGVYTPTSGKISVKGKTTCLLDPMLGMDGEATGVENIHMRGLLLGLKPRETKNIIREIVEFSELGEYINIPVRTYSSGMILRLAFAISTSITPEILIMDEWISIGDTSFKKKSEKRMHDFINKAVILVVATHDEKLIERISNRSIILNHGSIENKPLKY